MLKYPANSAFTGDAFRADRRPQVFNETDPRLMRKSLNAA
jgi:hypothetical protein